MALSVRTARLAFALPTKQIHHIWFGYSRLVILRLGLALGSARGSSHVGASACPRERDSRRMRADAVLTAERVLCAVPRTRGPRGLLAVPTHRSGHKCDTKIILPMKHFSSILEHNEPDINERTARGRRSRFAAGRSRSPPRRPHMSRSRTDIHTRYRPNTSLFTSNVYSYVNSVAPPTRLSQPPRTKWGLRAGGP